MSLETICRGFFVKPHFLPPEIFFFVFRSTNKAVLEILTVTSIGTVELDSCVHCLTSSSAFTHIYSGLVLFGHLLLDLQSAKQLFKTHHGHRDQPGEHKHLVAVQKLCPNKEPSPKSDVLAILTSLGQGCQPWPAPR